MQLQVKLDALRTAIPYIRAYKGRVFVIKLGGRLCAPGRAMDNLVDQLAHLHGLGIGLVVVHGGGEQMSDLSTRLGVEPEIIGGRRVTTAPVLEIAKMTLAGVVNTNIVAAFRKAGVAAVGVSGVDAGLIEAQRRPVQTLHDAETNRTREVDFGFVGDVVAVNAAPLRHLLAGDCVPVVGCLAADAAGQVYNVNADTVAASLAGAIEAAKLFLVTTVDGVLQDKSDARTLQTYLDLDQAAALVESGVISGGMLPKLAACRAALMAGVPRVHIINGLIPDTLLGEVFTNEGCGTLIVAKRNAKNNGTQGGGT
ncbi:MAG: acetylglutamate kinase [Phycisphaerae bacterium]|jgi:acetylglutamate kinase